MSERRAWVPRAVFALSLVPFLPALWSSFVDWDDPVFIVKNAHLARFDLGWMLTTTFGGHFHPLTWLSLGLDRALFGTGSFGVHLVNALLHAGSAVVLYRIARRLLGADLPAAVAALVFAIHPLRAESVAWAAERRDCLSGLFYLLTLEAWLDEKPGKALRWYLASLLSKGIGVTLPAALFALDWARGITIDRAWLRRVAPFAGLAAAFGVVGLWAERGNGAALTLEAFPLGARLSIAAYGLWFYPLKTLLPVGLIPLVPLPKPWPTLSQFPYGPMAAAALLAAALLWFERRERKVLAAGALFYAATVFPVLGLFKFGPQLVADRYSYLSCLPLALLAGAAVSRRLVPEKAAAAVLVALAALTWRQVSFWHDGRALWLRELAVRQDVPQAHHFLANGELAHGQPGSAEARERAALAVDPEYVPSVNGLGLALASQGRLEEACAQYRRALELKPGYWEAAANLGTALARLGRFPESARVFEDALRLSPDEAGLHANYGLTLLAAGKRADGEAHLDRALALDPDQPKLASIRDSLR